MIVIIPAVSWMFLRTGVDYRMESLKDLEMKEAFIKTDLLPDSISLNDHVSLICLDAASEKVAQLYDQFKDAPIFQLISTRPISQKIIDKGNFYTLGNDYAIKMEEYSKFRNAKYALIDGDSNIRRVYTSDEEIKILVRHIATILPYVERKKEKK